MHTKQIPISVKAVGKDGGLADGEMVAYAAISGNIDSYGDRMIKGAFDGTLEQWKSSGRRIPLLFAHAFSDPFANIGEVVSAVEDDRGLKIHARFDLEDNPTAKQVYKLVKGGRLSEMSFAFDIVDSQMVDGVRELREVKLYECSVVPIGANPETEILAVKGASELLAGRAAALKAGKPLGENSADDLTAALEQLREAIAAVEDALPDDGTDDGTGDGAPDAGAAAKSWDPSDPLIASFSFIDQPEPV